MIRRYLRELIEINFARCFPSVCMFLFDLSLHALEYNITSQLFA